MSTTPARLTSVATRECRRAIALSGHCRVTVWALSRAMGNKIVTFTEQQLEDYQDCTFFTRKEILRVFKRFRAVCPSLVPQQLSPSDARSLAVPLDKILTLPELKENPFKRRICEVFSHDGEGLTFDDFLDMMSVFSEAAPRDIKAWYAFRIYDLDNDLYIGKEDLLEASRLLTKGELQSPELDQIVASVLEEADMDGDGQLSFMDFEHVVVRAPDFLSTFHIRV
ncbi:calcium and integrin-binding family member 2 isoform X1 [Aricia agestis]|uniref:calcium and integrin-binding family member 2 isoform X1 n=1 Tax=Aricia agestis TaxID=91739 RepID=UPI001C20A775|nr:calcium and integrin-binding family member 2 isoform X1 [Aricia agestis]